MLQPTANDTDHVDESRSSQPEASGMDERLEGVEDELKLLKSEVKQTLIDLREFVMKGSATSVTSVFVGPASNGQAVAPAHQDSPPPQEPSTQPVSSQVVESEGQESLPGNDSTSEPSPKPESLIVDQTDQSEPAHEKPVSPVFPPLTLPPLALAPLLQHSGVGGPSPYSMDAIKMGHIIRWLGTIATKGFSPSYLRLFLQTYEQSGHLSPEMTELTYRSLEHLEYAMGRTSQTYSTVEYSDCLLELHEIICNPSYTPKNGSQTDRSQNG